MAAIVSWIEEVTGEDGLELSDESEEENQSNDPYALDTSMDSGAVDPKYDFFSLWKWFTILFQLAFVIEGCIMILWAFGEFLPGDDSSTETKSEIKEDQDND